MKKTQLVRYGGLRRREVEAGSKAEKAYDDSAWSENRTARLKGLTPDSLTSYGQGLLEEQLARLKALLDAPADGSVFSAVNSDAVPEDPERGGLLSRDIDVPRIGGLVLESAVPSDFMKEGYGHTPTYHLYFKADMAITDDELIDDLHIAGVASATENPTPSPFDHSVGSFGRNTINPNATLTASDGEAVSQTAQLEDSVETLRVICDSAGVEVEPVATIPEAPTVPN